jgi:DNA-binding PadR family transcriptional regulator
MEPKVSKLAKVNYEKISQDLDRQILALFPSINPYNLINERKKNAVLRHLATLYLIGKHDLKSTVKLSIMLNLPLSSVYRILRKLTSLSLLENSKSKNAKIYSLTSKGIIALTSFKEYQSFIKIKKLLAAPQKENDKLAYALLIIGYNLNNKDNTVFSTLRGYASHGHRIEQNNSEAIADSILDFFSLECKSKQTLPTNYIGVFKEFTTSGFQDILKILMSSMKPSLEDYNWLIEFFNATGEFYYNPERLAYINLLAIDSSLNSRLERYRKSQEKQVSKQGSQMEVTFNIPSSNIEKIEKYPNMPPYLKVIIMRLILEPTQFIRQELTNYFFRTKHDL